MKTSRTKNHLHLFLHLVLGATLLLFLSCSKDEESPTTTSEPDSGELVESAGITAKELGEERGSLGILIDTRAVVKKGYLPTVAEVVVNAVEGDYSDIIAIDEFTNLGRLSIAVEDLAEAALAELRNGVSLDIILKDSDETIVSEQSFSAESFRENGTLVVMDAKSLPLLNNTLMVNTELPHYIHLVYNEEFTNHVLESDDPSNLNRSHYTGTPFGIGPKASTMNMENVSSQFRLLPVSGKEDTYFIKAAWDEFYFGQWEDTDYWLFFTTNRDFLPQGFEFTLEMQESGNIRMKNYNGDYIYVHKDANGNINNLMHTSTGAPDNAIIAEFRLIPSTIQWEVESIVTKYLDPILPAVNTSFGINSTLSNCTSGTLEQEVVFEESIETSTTVAWEESIALTAERTSSFSTTVAASTSFSFFDIGVDASAEATKEYSTTTGFEIGQSTFEEASKVVTKNYALNRTIEVPPNSAVLVYDAYQTYNNVKMPFVQRFRIRGTDINDGIVLSGEEIKSQFAFSHFNGVISKTESDFVEVTLRGTITLDNYVDAKNEALEVPNECAE